MNYIKNKSLLFAVFVFLTFFSAVASAEIKALISIDKKDFSIGDNINIEFKFELPKNYELLKPEYDCIENWYVKNITLSRDKTNSGIYTVNIVATTFNPMQKELPSVKFFYLDEQKKQQAFSTDSVLVSVKDTLNGDVDEKHIKGIKPVKTIRIQSVYYYIALFFGCYLIFIIAMYFRKKHIYTSSYSKDKLKSKMLSKLESVMLNDENLDINARYDAVSEIIKNFIKIEYNLNASKMTSDAVVTELSKIELSSGIIKCLSALLVKCSAIKNSGLTLTEENINVDLANLNTIIKNSVQNKKSLSLGI